MSLMDVHQSATMQMQLGLYARAEKLFRDYIQGAERRDHDIAFVAAVQNVGFCLKKQGQYKEAKDWYARALALSRKLGLLGPQADNIANLAILLKNEGRALKDAGDHRAAYERFEEAAGLYRDARDLDHRAGNQRGVASDLHNLGILYTHMNERSRAAAAIEESIKLAEQTGDRGMVGKAQASMGRLFAAIDDLGLAATWLERSARSLAPLLEPAALAHTLLTLGKVRVKQGDREEGRRQLETAHRIYQSIELHSPESRECALALESLSKKDAEA